jgi:hypothetical protein
MTEVSSATKWFIRLFYTIVLIVIAGLFIENFIFSINSGELGFRGVNDIAFQAVLRSTHAYMDTGQYSRLLFINNYGYGWIYWIFITLVTYPLHILSTSFGIDWPLLSAPRQISLMFGALALYYLYKILRNLDFSEAASAFALAAFSLFPSFGFFSLEFGTTNAILLFSVLSVYLALKNEPSTICGRCLVAIALGICCAIKLTGLFIFPFIAFLILTKLSSRRAIPVVREIIGPIFVFLTVFVIGTNPNFLRYPLDHQVLANYWNIISHFMAIPKMSYDDLSPLARIYDGIVVTRSFLLCLMLLLGGLIVWAFKSQTYRATATVIIMLLLGIAAYLSVAVGNSSGMGSYYTSISFLFLFGVGGLQKLKNHLVLFVGILIFLVINIVVLINLQLPNHLYYAIGLLAAKDQVISAAATEKCIREDSQGHPPGHIFMDYTLPSTINTLSFPDTCVSVAWNDLSPTGKYCQRRVDYLVLDKSAIGFLPADDFEKKFSAVDSTIKAMLAKDRASRTQLLATGTFDSEKFHLLCTFGRAEVYKASN